MPPADTQPALILMCGMPGAGKSTLARRLASERPAVRLCPDDWMASLEVDLFDEPFRERLETVFWQHAQTLLGLGQSVILESGHWLRSDRDTKRLGARALGVSVELHYLDVSLDERWRRVVQRNHTLAHGTVELERGDLEEYVKYFQVPDDVELALFDPIETR